MAAIDRLFVPVAVHDADGGILIRRWKAGIRRRLSY